MVRLAVCLTILTGFTFLAPISARAQVDVSARIVLDDEPPIHTKDGPNVSQAVLWLSPVQMSARTPVEPAHPPYRMLQKDKQFTPHLLVVPTGSSVEFPNADPFFHNVFSLFDGKRFDLGLYESGTSRSVTFDREGISYIFCNIHPKMAAVILTLSTPYYAVSKTDGRVVIHGVPPGEYQLHVWSERARLLDTEKSRQLVRVSEDALNLGNIAMVSAANSLVSHKNKFGEEYKPDSGSPY
jgi:plastocyanin